MASFDIDAIRCALPIEELLDARGVRLRRGRGPCLVCGTSPSSTAFSIRDRRWHCFACTDRGDVIDLVARLDQLPLRDAIRRCAQMAGIAPGTPTSPIRPRPKSAWQIAREARAAAWWSYYEALRTREQIARLYECIARRYGIDHGVATDLGGFLGESYDREVLAECAYDSATGALP